LPDHFIFYFFDDSRNVGTYWVLIEEFLIFKGICEGFFVPALIDEFWVWKLKNTFEG
jgi:hypothetical protein